MDECNTVSSKPDLSTSRAEMNKICHKKGLKKVCSYLHLTLFVYHLPHPVQHFSACLVHQHTSPDPFWLLFLSSGNSLNAGSEIEMNQVRAKGFNAFL